MERGRIGIKDARGKVMTSSQDGHSDELLSFKPVQSVFLYEDFPNLMPVVSVHSGEQTSLTLYVLHFPVPTDTHILAKRRKGARVFKVHDYSFPYLISCHPSLSVS